MKPPRLDLNTGEILRGKALWADKHRSRYKPEPTDLADLMERAGPMADAVRHEVEWGAISFWLMGGHDTSHPALAASEISNGSASFAVGIVWEALLHENGWPVLSGEAVIPLLYSFTENAQSEARQVAAKVYELWEQADRPHVDAVRCKQAFQCLTSAVRKGLIDPLPGIPGF